MMRFVGNGDADPFEKSTSSLSVTSIMPRGGCISRESWSYARSASAARRRASGSSGGVKLTRKWRVVSVRQVRLGAWARAALAMSAMARASAAARGLTA